MLELLFPIASIVLTAGAAVVYAYVGNWRKAIYWTAATILTASVTF